MSGGANGPAPVVTRRELVAAGAIAAAALALPGCGDGGGDEAVQSEPAATNPSEGKLAGKLVLRTCCREELVNAVVPAFMEKTGVTVRLIESDARDLLSWHGSEDADAGAGALDPVPDVVWGADQSWYEGSENLLAEYISGENDAMREGCRNAGGRITPLTREVTTLLVRNDKDGHGVTGYASLLDEGVATRVALEDPTVSEVGLAHLAGIVAELGELGEETPREFLAALLDGGALVTERGAALTELEDGVADVALVDEGCLVRDLLVDPTTVNVVYPEEGPLVTCGCTAIVVGCEHLSQAQAWVDFVTGTECQQLISTEAVARPVRADVADPEGFPEVGDPVVPAREALLEVWSEVLAR